MISAQAEITQLIDNALDSILTGKGSAFLFGFSVSALGHISPGLLIKPIDVHCAELAALQEKYRGDPPESVFPELKRIFGVRRDLIDNIYQSIQGNDNIDDIAEIISWIRVALERESYSSSVITDIFRDSIKSGLECAMHLPK